LYSWGANGVGQLGGNSTASVSTPTKVGALTNWLYVAGGNAQSLAVKTNNTLWAWGSNYRGGLGDNTVVDKSSPIQIGALTNWSKVAAGLNSSFALKTDGTLWAWGYNNSFGQLGDGTVINRSSPVQVGSLTGWIEIAAGIRHTLAVRSNGTLWAWGSNSDFGLGSSGSSTSSPVQVGALTNWYQVSAGQGHSMAVKTDNTLWAWGKNSTGQLGLGNTVIRSSPVQVGALTNWSQISCLYEGSASVKTDGTMWGWGQNSSGMVGDGTVINRSSPVQVGALTNWKSLAEGSRREFNLSIKTDGTLWSWGDGANGNLGLGDTSKRSSPVQVGVSTSWYQAAGGGGFSLALIVVP
jgi:alpha-tubulin suppressor-like RCC1 family protein